MFCLCFVLPHSFVHTGRGWWTCLHFASPSPPPPAPMSLKQDSAALRLLSTKGKCHSEPCKLNNCKHNILPLLFNQVKSQCKNTSVNTHSYNNSLFTHVRSCSLLVCCLFSICFYNLYFSSLTRVFFFFLFLFCLFLICFYNLYFSSLTSVFF